MKNRLILFCALLFVLGTQAGTSVGNFNYREQMEFDFRIMYAHKWQLAAASEESANVRERWYLTNQSQQIPAEQASTISAQFLLNFPAKDVNGLLAQIQKMHPGEVWNSISNPEIDGYYSAQKTIGAGKTKNFEYYFSKPGQVVKLENIRSEIGNGAAELEVTLATIRRPSQAPKIQSIEMDKKPNEVYQPGERACYFITLDSMKTGANINSFEINGIPNYWSFQNIFWNAKLDRFEICQELTAAMPADGLLIRGLSVSWGQTTLHCSGEKDILDCHSYTNGPPKSQKIQVRYPSFSNPSPDREGPRVLQLAKTSKGDLFLQASDTSGVQIVDVSLQFGNSEPKKIIFYADELTSAGAVKKVPSQLLLPGFNLVSSITLFDRLGNVTVFKATPGANFYMTVNNQGVEALSNFPLVSIFGGGQ